MGVLSGLRDWVRGDTVKRDAALDALGLVMAERIGGVANGSVPVTQDSARRHSAVWACRRLRADLISTMPVDVYRRVGGIQVEVTPPPFLQEPAPGMSLLEWLYSSQDSLDSCGNAVGVITATDGAGKPRYVEWVPMSSVTAKVVSGQVAEWKIGSRVYLPSDVWHEKQFTVPGSPIGLDPVLYAAWTIGAYLGAQKYGLDYFGSGGMPSGVLQHQSLPSLTPDVTAEAKARFKASTANRDVFVVGRDWTWTPAASEAAASAFLEDKKYGAADVCRFFGVPADMVDAGTSSSSVTYANITQRNLQFLIMNLGPAIIRREDALSRALAAPRYVKLNSDALLRMDPETRSKMLVAQVAGRLLAPSEARELDNRGPFTPEQLAEFESVGLNKTSTPGSAA